MSTPVRFRQIFARALAFLFIAFPLSAAAAAAQDAVAGAQLSWTQGSRLADPNNHGAVANFQLDVTVQLFGPPPANGSTLNPVTIDFGDGSTTSVSPIVTSSSYTGTSNIDRATATVGFLHTYASTDLKPVVTATLCCRSGTLSDGNAGTPVKLTGSLTFADLKLTSTVTQSPVMAPPPITRCAPAVPCTATMGGVSRDGSPVAYRLATSTEGGLGQAGSVDSATGVFTMTPPAGGGRFAQQVIAQTASGSTAIEFVISSNISFVSPPVMTSQACGATIPLQLGTPASFTLSVTGGADTSLYLSGAPEGSTLTPTGGGSYTFAVTPTLGFQGSVMQIAAVGSGGMSTCIVTLPLKVVRLVYLSGIVRDFSQTSADFNGADGDAGLPIVSPTLGADGKPVFQPQGSPATVQSAASFNHWFNDTSSSVFSFTANDANDPTGQLFTYSNNAFYPIDGQLGGNQGDAHNRFFTYEIHTYVPYNPGQVLSFTSSDDMWVFIDNMLVVDMGGIHTPTTKTLNMDEVRVGGQPLQMFVNHAMAIFFAHRGAAHDPAFGITLPQATLCDIFPATPQPQVSANSVTVLGRAAASGGTIQPVAAGVIGASSGAVWAAKDGVPAMVQMGDGFATEFDFTMVAPSEGFAFVMQTDGPGARGADGGNLGYSNISRSLAIEFDPTSESIFNDPSCPHIAVNTRFDQGNSADHRYSLGMSSCDPFVTVPLADGRSHHVRIEYRPGAVTTGNGPAAALGWLFVYVDRVANSPSQQPRVQVQVDGVLLNADVMVNGAAYVGFTGGTDSLTTGASTISNWTFETVGPKATSTLQMPGLAFAQQPGGTTISAASACGLPMLNGGFASQFSTTMAQGAHSVPATIADNRNGTYAIAYTPDVEGMWTVNAAVNGTPLTGSPAPARVNALTSLTLTPFSVTVGQGATLTARLTRAYDGAPLTQTAVSFTMDQVHVFNTITGADGTAQIHISATPPGITGYQVTYAGNAGLFLQPASATAPITETLATATLQYTGDAGANLGAPLHVQALLANQFGPVANENVKFTLGSNTIIATTGPNGIAAGPLPTIGVGGLQTVTVTHDATIFNSSASTTAQVTINLPTVFLFPAPVPQPFGQPATLTTKLVMPPNTPVAGATVHFTRPDASTVDVVTDQNGIATITVTGLPLGQSSFSVSFAGDPANALLPTRADSLVTLTDQTAPVIGALSDLSAEASSAGGAIVNFPAPSATDAVDGTPTVTVSPASGSTFPLGSTTVTVTATDHSGNSSTATFHIVIVDTTAPSITVPANISLTAADATGAVATFTASAADLVDGNVSVTCAPSSGSTFAIGTTNVLCSAADAHGNGASAGFTVTVVAAGPAPTISTPDQKTVEATGPSGASVTFTVTARLQGQGAVPVMCSPASGSIFAVGTAQVTCTASSPSGATATATFPVTVRDTRAPKLDLPDRQVLEATSPAGAVAIFTAAATDLVDVTDPVVCAPASGSTFPIGRTAVTCTATDAAGNSRSGAFTIVVRDTIAPDIAGITPSMTALPPTGLMTAVTFGVDVTDAADASPVCAVTRVSSNVHDADRNGVPDWQITGPLSVSLEAATRNNRDRVYTITVRCSDASGNPSRDKTTVVVSQQ
jgi:fibro-slime domain-containing protein